MGKFAKKLVSVENIKEARSEQLVRNALLSTRPGSTPLITLLEKKWFEELNTVVAQLESLGLADTRTCAIFSKSQFSDKCVSCGRRLPPHEEEQATYLAAVRKGQSRRQLARDERKLGWNPLHFALLAGAPLETVRALLKFCPAWAAQRDPAYGRFPLHAAARVREVEELCCCWCCGSGSLVQGRSGAGAAVLVVGLINVCVPYAMH